LGCVAFFFGGENKLSIDWGTLIATNLIPVICVFIAVIILKKRKVKKIGKDGVEFYDTDECGALQQKHEIQLNKIEKLLEDDVQERKTRQVEVDKKFNEIDNAIDKVKCNLDETNEILLKVSEDTQYSIFIEEKASIDERLKAFRILVALGRNGDVKKDGYKLILNNKDIWKIVIKSPLPVKIKDQKHYDETFEYINKLVFDVTK
jgi:hypothetical protein